MNEKMAQHVLAKTIEKMTASKKWTQMHEKNCYGFTRFYHVELPVIVSISEFTLRVNNLETTFLHTEQWAEIEYSPCMLFDHINNLSLPIGEIK